MAADKLYDAAGGGGHSFIDTFNVTAEKTH
jgi:hypothetical protein